MNSGRATARSELCYGNKDNKVFHKVKVKYSKCTTLVHCTSMYCTHSNDNNGDKIARKRYHGNDCTYTVLTCTYM